MTLRFYFLAVGVAKKGDTYNICDAHALAFFDFH